jgi:Zn-dependent protease
VCAQTAIDNSGAPPPEGPTPPRRGTQITPVQWIGLAVLAVLFLYQAGALNAPGGINGYLQEIGPRLIALFLAITIHEFSHGLVATLFGDGTPRRAGRLTLNPLKHLDPIGTIMMVVGPIGWGRPMPINPGEMRRSNLGWALSSLAGPVSNILLATVVAILVTLLLPNLQNRVVESFIGQLVQINILLAVFNLLPIPPLDGFGVVFGLAPRQLKLILLPLLRYGPLILLAVVFLPGTQQYLDAFLTRGATIIYGFIGALTGGL